MITKQQILIIDKWINPHSTSGELYFLFERSEKKVSSINRGLSSGISSQEEF